MTILFINNEYCNTLTQLKGYFNRTLNPLDELYQDLIDNGRDNIISKWLQEHGEIELAIQLENIKSDLCDSEFFAKMSAIVLGRKDITIPCKTEFSKVLTIEKLHVEKDSYGTHIKLKIRVLLSINESYELKIQTSWGTKVTNINPYTVAEKEFITEVFNFRKRPGKDFVIEDIFADGEKLEKDLIRENDKTLTHLPACIMPKITIVKGKELCVHKEAACSNTADLIRDGWEKLKANFDNP